MTYDGNGLLATQTSAGTTADYAWNTQAATPLLLTDGQTSFIYGPGGSPLEQISATGAVSYLHHDQLGSTRMITSATGGVIATYGYDATGALTSETGGSDTPLLWNGQYESSATGFYYLRARYYDPDTDQFTTADPLNALTGQPFTYADDNPVNESDPAGLWLGASWLPSPGQAADSLGSTVSTVGGVLWHEALPIGEALSTVAACATPFVDAAACPAAITGFAALNVGYNDYHEYEAALSGCPVSGYLYNDGAELSIGALGAGTYAVGSAVESGLEAIPVGTTGVENTMRAAKAVNGLATGAGLAGSAAQALNSPAVCLC